MTFKHDSTGVDPNGGFPLLPSGAWYDFKIASATEKVSANGNNMVECSCKVINDEKWKDHEVTHRIVFLPATSKGAGISVHFRKAIGEPYGGADEVNADNWVGKRFRGYVETDEYTATKGKNIGKKFKQDKIVEIEAPTVPNAEIEVPF